MKSRVLTILSLAFAFILFSRAYAVSTDISDPATKPTADHTKQKHGMNAEKPGAQMATQIDKAHSTPQQCLTGSMHEAVAADLQRLTTRTLEIEKREAALAALETSLTAQLAGVEAANERLSVKINGLKSVAGEDLKHLVGMYQTMKPKQASEIFDSMDPAFAAGFLREMDSQTAGLIMANMDARKSYAISVIIAGKNAKYR